jgi:hypothetical protein
MATVGQLQQYIRDAGLEPDVPVAIQAYGKAAKHYAFELRVVGGELIIAADLAPRNRPSRDTLTEK